MSNTQERLKLKFKVKRGRNDGGGWPDSIGWTVTFNRPGQSYNKAILPEVAHTFGYSCGLGHIEWQKGFCANRMKYSPQAFSIDPDDPQKLKCTPIFGRVTIAQYESAQADFKGPKPPEAAGVLYSLALDCGSAEEIFSDWCDSLGYSDDSIKAMETYRACQENLKKFRELFGPYYQAALEFEWEGDNLPDWLEIEAS